MNENKGSFLSKVFAYLIRVVLGIIMFTCKFKVKGREHLDEAAKKGPTIIMFWHNRIVAVGTFMIKTFRSLKFCAFVSNSKDGDILAHYCNSFRRGGVIRVPHDSKDKALKAMISRLRFTKDVLIITPDGPRGPIYEVKPGVAIAAKEAKASIVPFDWKAKSYWELNTWDRLRIPKPFTTIEFTFSKPIRLDSETPLEPELDILKASLPSS